jgi:hypothetical protein
VGRGALLPGVVVKLQLLLTTLSAPLLQARVCEPVVGLVPSVQVKLEPDWMVTKPGFESGVQLTEVPQDETLVSHELAEVRGPHVGVPMVTSSPAEHRTVMPPMVVPTVSLTDNVVPSLIDAGAWSAVQVLPDTVQPLLERDAVLQEELVPPLLQEAETSDSVPLEQL